MRRNLRLDWRALALLGALLSIIIDWSGVVYAMPTKLPAVNVRAAEAAPIDTLNIITSNNKMLKFFPIKTKTTAAVKFLPHRESEFTLTTSVPPLAVTATSMQQQQQQPQQRLTIITEKQQVNELYNSISNKHIINDKTENEQIEITATHQQNSHDEEVTTTTAASAAITKQSLLNTHTNNSTTTTTNNIISSTKSISPITATAIASTTESSAKIQSTLTSSLLVEPLDTFNLEKSSDLLNNFKLSSHHHLAILSRTERSIRAPSSSSSVTVSAAMPSTLNGSSSSNSSSSSSSSNNSRGSRNKSGLGGVMVRRSSADMSVTKSKRLNNSRNLFHKNNLDRNERSTVSHLSGPSRKIQLYIKNRFLQLLPDGTVNGTQDEQCDYTILQRSTVEVGRIKIQGVATCLYLCMDPCGAVYGSKEFTDDCVFNESMEQHNYNTYSSTYNSNARRKYYLALNRHGEPRKLQIPPSRSLGKLATYTNAIPETVPQERVEQLIAKNFGANRVKHGIRQLCDTGKPLIELIDSKNFKARPKCNPNNSNNISNSKNTLSRNLDNDKDSLGNHHSHHHQHTNDNNNNNNNGQVFNNVPVANDKNNLSSNSRSSSSSSSNSKPETNRDNSSSSPSSISISQSNGHISSSSSSNSFNKHSSSSSSSSSNPSDNLTAISRHDSSTAGSHRGGKKAGKKRKCRRFENEEQHNCTAPLNRPTNLIKRGNQMGPIRQQKCRDLLQQQQLAGVSDIVLPPMCTKKGGGNKKQHGNSRKGSGKNNLNNEGLNANNRRGKKINRAGAGKQAAKNNSSNHTNNNNGGSKKKPKNSKKGGGNNNNNNSNRKNNKKASKVTTTEKVAASHTLSTSTLKSNFWETTSLTPSTTLLDNYEPHAEATSDRGDREQRNVRYSNSMEEYMEQSSEDTSAGEDLDEDDNDMETNDESNEDNSYEDDGPISSSQVPYTAAESSHTSLTAGAEDFLYYDQLDFLPLDLWKFIAALWLMVWSIHILS